MKYEVPRMLKITPKFKEKLQAVLIRSVQGVFGPGQVAKLLRLNKSLCGEDLATSTRFLG